MINTIEIKWDLLGARLAILSDKEQGEFFHGFAQELSRYESGYKRQMQMCFISDKLTKEDKEILGESLPCIYMKEQKP
jgi:hypothetical protein